MIISDVNFVASFTRESMCPTDGRPEFAFIGRSNVGKSSLINLITDRKQLAKTSGTPGKTQLLNYFDVDATWYLVDLPGYGYARTSKSQRATFQKMIETYLRVRATLALAFILIDIRHPLQKIDSDFINWCGDNQVPFAIIFTKSDKITKNQVIGHANTILKELKKTWQELPPQFITSAETGAGKEEVLTYIGDVLKTVKSNANQID
jgi:GTP-binding protein